MIPLPVSCIGSYMPLFIRLRDQFHSYLDGIRKIGISPTERAERLAAIAIEETNISEIIDELALMLEMLDDGSFVRIEPDSVTHKRLKEIVATALRNPA